MPNGEPTPPADDSASVGDKLITASNVNAKKATPDDIRESLVISNIKCIAEQPCVLANLALANAVEGQQLTATIARQAMYRAVEMLTEPRTTSMLASMAPFMSTGGTATT